MIEVAPRRGLAVVLLATVVTLGLGWLLKSPCLGPWNDGRQYNRLCYSDVAALYGAADRDRGLSEDRVPYLDGENEYPVLTGITMWITALPATSYPTYFNWNVLLLGASALGTAAILHRIAGSRALLFALAPTLLIYGFMNWDLVPVLLATAATLAFLRERDVLAGALVGLGTAAKLYPALLLLPFALARLREGRAARMVPLALTAGATWLAVNLPFAVAAPDRWMEFWRFNATRPADWDSQWYIGARHLGFTWEAAVVNGLALAAFAGSAVALWFLVARRIPPGRLWTLAFPLVVLFLLTSKVYSPQYGLWLLPWFVLALPDLRLFAAFQVADAAVFVTRFQFFASLQGTGEGMPQESFDLAVAVRAVILVACVVVWARRELEPPPRSQPAPAPGYS